MASVVIYRQISASRLEAAMKNQSSPKVHRSVILWLLSGIFACIGVAAYYSATGIQDYQAFSFAISVTATLLHGTAAVFYLRGLRYFKTNLRVAYALLSAGIAMLGIAFAQLPIINRFDQAFWSDSGLMLLPYLLSVGLIFGGIRQFARSANLTGRWFSFGWVSVAAIVAGIVMALLPHAPSKLDDVERLVSVWLTTVIAVFFVFVARGTLLIKRSVGASYSFGLAWLFIAMVAAAIGAAHYVGVLIVSPGRGFYYDWSIAILLFNVTGWLFMKAGHAFNMINEVAVPAHYPNAWRKFFGLPKSAKQIVSSIDIIVYAMGLASDPARVDALVDDMRAITASGGTNDMLSSHDQEVLLQTYRRIEDYLVDDEPLRSFSRQQVRENIEKQFGWDNVEEAAGTFWSQVAR